MTGIRTEQFLRSLENTFTCPDVLAGEVHDDSQHVSAALWKARQDHFLGNDNGARFDAAFYATLVSLSATADFAQVAAVMTAHVNSAFPGQGQLMSDLFAQKGVTGCSKVVDMTGAMPRPRYGIGARAQSPVTSGFIPGPHQLKLRVPNGARSVQVTGQIPPDPLAGFGGGAPRLKALARAGGPITFIRVGSSLQNDATGTADVTIAQGNATATINLDVPCGPTSEVYVTVANDGQGPTTLQNLTLSATPAATCSPPDAGPGGDGGMTIVLPGIGVVEGQAQGCGCGASPWGAPVVLLVALALRRRRRS
jgi:hypothetical protein